MRSWMQLSIAMDIPVCNMLCQPEKCDKLKEYGMPCSFFMTLENNNVKRSILNSYELVC